MSENEVMETLPRGNFGIWDITLASFPPQCEETIDVEAHSATIEGGALVFWQYCSEARAEVIKHAFAPSHWREVHFRGWVHVEFS